MRVCNMARVQDFALTVSRMPADVQLGDPYRASSLVNCNVFL